MAGAGAHKLDLGRRRAPGRRIRKRAVDRQWAEGIEARRSMRTVEGSKPWPGLARHDASRAGKWSWPVAGHCTAPEWSWSHNTLRCPAPTIPPSYVTSLESRPIVDTVVRSRPSSGQARAGLPFEPFECNQRLDSFPVPATSERIDTAGVQCLGRWVAHRFRGRALSWRHQLGAHSQRGGPPQDTFPQDAIHGPSQLRPLQIMIGPAAHHPASSAIQHLGYGYTTWFLPPWTWPAPKLARTTLTGSSSARLS